MKKIKIEFSFTKELKDRMIVYAPHTMKPDQWPEIQDVLDAMFPYLQKRKKWYEFWK